MNKLLDSQFIHTTVCAEASQTCNYRSAEFEILYAHPSQDASDWRRE